MAKDNKDQGMHYETYIYKPCSWEDAKKVADEVKAKKQEPKPKTWQDIRTFDDIILDRERAIIEEIERTQPDSCPDLKKKGKYFYYCGRDLLETPSDVPSPVNEAYQNHLGTAELGHFCKMNYDKCARRLDSNKK